MLSVFFVTEIASSFPGAFLEMFAVAVVVDCSAFHNLLVDDYGSSSSSRYNAIQNNTTLLSLRREICLLVRLLHKTFNALYNKTFKN